MISSIMPSARPLAEVRGFIRRLTVKVQAPNLMPHIGMFEVSNSMLRGYDGMGWDMGVG